jgi:elongation factor Tu
MPVEDVFSITGRGTVATGRIETGVAKEIQLKSLVWELKINFYYWVEMFRKILDREAGITLVFF